MFADSKNPTASEHRPHQRVVNFIGARHLSTPANLRRVEPTTIKPRYTGNWKKG